MSRSLQDSASRGVTVTHDSPTVRIYLGTLVQDSYGQPAFDHCKSFLDETLDLDWISGYELYWYTSGFSPNCDKSILSQFDTFRSRNGYQEEGMHVAINACNFTKQNSTAVGAMDGGNPWQEDVNAQTVTQTYGSDRAQDQVNDSTIHEPMHGWSLTKCPDCTDLMYYDPNENSYLEHSLGTVFDNLYGFRNRWETAIGEGDRSIKNGDCYNSSGSANNITSKPSQCEMEAIQYGADHSAGYHDH